jgi:Ala-tRNA(Pro) deacylase
VTGPTPTTAADADDRGICRFLDEHGIAYERIDHPAVFTCDEQDRLVGHESAAVRTKNLFLRDKKGHRHWLVVTLCAKQFDIAALGARLGAGRLSFGSPERLHRYLGVAPGSVTLLALAHEGAREVELIVDEEVWSGAPIRCHPLVNTATLILSKAGVERFLAATGHVARVLRL